MSTKINKAHVGWPLDVAILEVGTNTGTIFVDIRRQESPDVIQQSKDAQHYLKQIDKLADNVAFAECK